jgi:hypothetical protein
MTVSPQYDINYFEFDLFSDALFFTLVLFDTLSYSLLIDKILVLLFDTLSYSLLIDYLF